MACLGFFAMCTNPKTIYNRATYIGNRSKIMLDVPCGKCDECRSNKVLDYQMRCECAFYKSLEKGGFGFFDTLTYNNSCLPHVGDIPCFSRDDINAFFKRLRGYFQHYFGTSKGMFDYFLVSEFGTDKKRPHYHVLFFVYVPMSIWKFKRWIKASWHYGFVDPLGQVQKHILVSCAAVRYICKYVSKIQEWSLEYHDRMQEYLAANNIVDLEKINQFYRKVTPFQLASNNIGLDWLVRNANLDKAEIKISNNLGVRVISFSTYYMHKVYYILTKDDDKYRYVINDLGINFKLKTLKDGIENYAKKLLGLVSSLDSNSVNHIQELLGKRSLYDVAVYYKVFKDCFGADALESGPLPDIESWYIRSQWPTYTFDNPMYSDNTDERKSSRERLASNIVSSNVHHFSGFDEVLAIFKEVERENKEKYYEAQKRRDEIKKNLLILNPQ